MSITDIAATGWTAFWNNICSAGTLGIVIAMVVVCLLLGFAFGRTMGCS